jgi:cytochrome b561
MHALGLDVSEGVPSSALLGGGAMAATPVSGELTFMQIVLASPPAEHGGGGVNGGGVAMRVGDQVVGYTRAMQAMHWGTVALLICAYLAAWMIDGASSPAEKAWLIMLHRSFGITILLLTWMRLAFRLRTRVPPLPADVPAVQRLAARASVITLYAVLIVQPLLGLAASMLHGGRTMVFGSVVLRPLLPVDRAFAHQVFHRVYAWTSLALLALIGMHVVAALHHHFVRKDEVLAGMLPGVQRQPRPVNLAPG